MCNAIALEELGGKVVCQIGQDFPQIVKEWLEDGNILQLPEVSDEEVLVQKIISAGTGIPHKEHKAGNEKLVVGI